MSFTGKILSFAGISSLAVSAAFAQSLPPSVAACTSEKDSLARLVCFDREVAKYPQAAARVAPTPAAPPVVSPPAASVATTQQPAASQPADEFGVTGSFARKRQADKEANDTAIKELKAGVSSIRKKPYGELVLALDNGQTWEQIEAKSSFIIKEGEGVTIRPAKFGSFMLTTDAGASTRVRRTK